MEMFKKYKFYYIYIFNEKTEKNIKFILFLGENDL